MGKRCFPVICFILAATLISTETHGVTPAQLGALNFNLYSKPSTANEMVLRDLSGTPVSLAALRGKVIILNFWKIDCIPCAAEKAILERIHRKYGPRGLAILAVNLFDNYDRMRECVGHGGYSLTFAYDPEKRYTARTQALRGGMPTCFVINPNADAIYEIPVVPTTYVVNRDGQIVGHSFGMMNWEQPAYMDLLESLLRPPTQMLAQAPPQPTAPSRQKPAVVTESPSPLPSPRQDTAAEATPRFPSGLGTAGPLPSQSPSPPVVMASEQPPPASSPRAKTSKQAEAKSVGRRDASTRTTQAKPGASTPAPPHQPTRAAQTVSPQGALPGAAYGPGAPRNTASEPIAATGAVRPSSLPPARPYGAQGTQPSYTGSPGGASRVQPPAASVDPDKDGYVMANVPGQAGRRGTEPQRVRPTSSAAPPLTPAVMPLERQDSFNRLVLDSFGPQQSQPVVRQAAPPPPRSSAQTDWSLIGQVNRLRTGIRDALTRALPGR